MLDNPIFPRKIQRNGQKTIISPPSLYKFLNALPQNEIYYHSQLFRSQPNLR